MNNKPGIMYRNFSGTGVNALPNLEMVFPDTVTNVTIITEHSDGSAYHTSLVRSLDKHGWNIRKQSVVQRHRSRKN